MKRNKSKRKGAVAKSEQPPLGPKYVNAYFEGLDIVFVERNDDGVKLHRQRALGTTFFKASDLSHETLRMFKESPLVYSIRREGEWYRLVWRGSRYATAGYALALEEKGIPTYEATISPIRRFVADHQVRIQRPRCVYLDIETDSDVPIILAVKGKARVLCWTMVDSDGKKMAALLQEDTDEDEKRILDKLWRCLQDYDQVATWGGKRFDVPVIKLRSKKVKAKNNNRQWLWLDQLELFKRFNMSAAESGAEKQSMKLDRVASALLGTGKDPFDASKTRRAWDNNTSCTDRSCMRCRTCLLLYCLQDTDLLRQIEDVTGYIELLYKVCEVTGAFPDTYGVNPGNFVENYLLRVGAEVNHHFPTRVYDENFVEEPYEGAYVMKPPRVNGVERNVHVADFSALYPSIIRTWNMSPETLVKKGERAPDEPMCNTATEAMFTTNKKGVLVIALERMVKLRSKWKKLKASYPPGTAEWKDADRRSTAYKIAINSFYGVIGSPMARMYSRDVAECVTKCGVFLLKLTMRMAEEQGMTIVYGDTDSLFVKGETEERFSEFVTWCNEVLYPETLKGMGCVDNEIDLGYEKMFNRLVMTRAKKYAGSYVHYDGTRASDESKPEIKGLEFKRGDTAQFARDLQEEVVYMVLGHKQDAVSDPRDMVVVVERWQTLILHDPLKIHQVQITKKLSKRVQDYSQKVKLDGELSLRLPHVEIAAKLIEQGHDIGIGDRVSYVLTDGSETPKKFTHVDEAVIRDEDGTIVDIIVDRHSLWDDLVFPHTERFLVAAFPNFDWSPWAKTRPKKPRTRKQKPVSKDQLLMIFAELESNDE